MFNWPTFVLQRRINEPLGTVEQVLCDPTLLHAGASFDLRTNAARARLDAPFGVTFPPFGLDGASWVAPVTVLTRRGRTVVKLELEINVWDTNSTELVLRPRARHPQRWGGRRVGRYFRVAHATADAFAQLLGSRAALRILPDVRYRRVLIV